MKEYGGGFNPFSNLDPGFFSHKMGIFNWGNDLAKAKLEDESEEEDHFSVINSQWLWCGCAVYVFLCKSGLYIVCACGSKSYVTPYYE